MWSQARFRVRQSPPARHGSAGARDDLSRLKERKSSTGRRRGLAETALGPAVIHSKYGVVGMAVVLICMTRCQQEQHGVAPMGTTLCSIAARPWYFDGRTVTAFFITDGIEHSALYDETCANVVIAVASPTGHRTADVPSQPRPAPQCSSAPPLRRDAQHRFPDSRQRPGRPPRRTDRAGPARPRNRRGQSVERRLFPLLRPLRSSRSFVLIIISSAEGRNDRARFHAPGLPPAHYSYV